MDVVFLGSLALLALIDSTSFGTLLIPIWLLLYPGRVRPTRMLLFLGTVASFYFVIGLLLALGAIAFLPQITALLNTQIANWVQLVVGVALFFLSFRLGRKRRMAPADGGRIARWRERALGTASPDGDVGAGQATASLVGLALTAAALEITTMLPYLAAIGLITTSGLTIAGTALVMAAYCLVMVTPALVLLALRFVAGRRIEPMLTRISDWMTNSDTLAWIVGIVGFLLARDAVARLGLLNLGGS
jgi:cytochrome c biogenesis protein CcdA